MTTIAQGATTWPWMCPVLKLAQVVWMASLAAIV